MNHIFELSHSTLARIPFFKILLFALLLGVGRVNGQIIDGQTVYFGDSWIPMSTTDGVNYTLSNFDGNSYSLNCYFYSDFDGTFYVGTINGSGVAIPGAWDQMATLSPILYQSITFNIYTHEYSLVPGACNSTNLQISISSNLSDLIIGNLAAPETFNLNSNPANQLYYSGWNLQWKKDGQNIPGATTLSYTATPDQQGVYTCQATCATSGQTLTSNAIKKIAVLSDINYMLIQNVTVTGINASQGTAQVQFDINWGNAWKDSINWDAAWVFMKYKNAAGEWKHAKINATGYDHGQGTNNIIQPTTDKMGAFVRLADYGQTNFSVDGMQLQWNYGLDGLSNVSNVEVKLFATEMVYMPQGDFNVIATSFAWESTFPQHIKAPGENTAVINTRLTPVLHTGNGTQFRVKGDAGLDSNADGTVDSPNYPTGYAPFYAFKYEMTEQQYADYLNCLSVDQQNTIGVAGSSISLNNGAYYASSPNRVCFGFTNERFLSFADWSGLRPMSVLEFSKAALGPYSTSVGCSNRPWWGAYDAGRAGYNPGSGYYGMKDAQGGSANEPVINIESSQFSKLSHGDGMLGADGLSNQANWSNIGIIWANGPFGNCDYYLYDYGLAFRFARTAE